MDIVAGFHGNCSVRIYNVNESDDMLSNRLPIDRQEEIELFRRAKAQDVICLHVRNVLDDRFVVPLRDIEFFGVDIDITVEVPLGSTCEAYDVQEDEEEGFDVVINTVFEILVPCMTCQASGHFN